MTFGKVILDYRHEHGLTQQEIADRTNGVIARNTISMAERSTNYQPSPTTLRALAKLMNITVDELITLASKED